MISVIMLTYNRETLVSRAIESVLNQTYRDFEFVIVDNGSTDRSGQIAEEYAARDSRIRVIHKERGNIGSGRNAGLDAAQGEAIGFIDDDDFLEPGYLEHLEGLIRDRRADVAVCGSWREVDGVREAKYVFDGVYTYNGEEAVYEMLKRERLNSGMPAKLISAHLFRDLRYDSSSKYDDIRMTYKVLAAAQAVAVTGIPLYTCVRHQHNNSMGTVRNERIPPGQVEEYLSAFRERTEYLTARFPDRADFWLYTELSYALSMYDKTSDKLLKDHLKKRLSCNMQALMEAKEFYSARDRSLLLKYKGVFL